MFSMHATESMLNVVLKHAVVLACLSNSLLHIVGAAGTTVVAPEDIRFYSSL